jgi:hypothetical protein
VSKGITRVEGWTIYDTARDPINPASNYLLADNIVGMGNQGQVLDILSNGFKLKNATTSINVSGATYIFAAFAETPFKYAMAR